MKILQNYRRVFNGFRITGIIAFMLTVAIGRSQSIAVEKLKFVSSNDTLVGYLSKPVNVNPFPVVIVLHSASFGTHDKPIYNHLAKTLNEIGVGVFIYDRRGSGESGGSFSGASLEDLAKDGVAALNTLKARSDVIKSKVGLYGVSQGGWIAPIVYNFAKEEVAFMILVSSCGATPADQMDYTAKTTLLQKGFDKKTINTALHLRSVINNYYRGIISYDSASRIVENFRNTPWFKYSWLPLNQNGKLPDRPKESKWYKEMDFSPGQYFGNIKIPIMLIYGSHDAYVPIDLSIAVWKKALKNANNSDYRIYRVKRSGHLMIIDEDRSPQTEVISNDYTQYLKSWTLEILKRRQ